MGHTFDIDERAIGNDAVVTALRSIDKHQMQTNEKLDLVGKKLDLVAASFPSGDFEGHRRYHETMIDMLAERRRLRVAIQEKTISGLVWAAVVGIGISVWHEVVSMANR